MADAGALHTEVSTGSELPRFIKDEFEAFLKCGILAHGFLCLRCAACGHDKFRAFSCKHRGFCPSRGARRRPRRSFRARKCNSTQPAR
jgi:Transposase zinc-binding domain